MISRMMGGYVRSSRRLTLLLILVLAACDDPFGPAVWDATPDTMLLYSASRAEYLGFPSALDITSVPVQPVPLEAPSVTGNWDLALLDNAGGLALAPSGAFAGLESRARIAVLANRTLDSVTQASRDTTTYTADPVQIELGNVYVVRSRRASCGISSGYRYAKLRPVEINVAAGTYRFEIVRNPYCDNRSFIPPEE